MSKLNKVGDWISEQSTTQGTGDIILSGVSQQNKSSFRDGVLPGEVLYTIIDGENAETGTGTFDGNNTITRDNIDTTIVNGTVNNTNPSPIPLSGNAVIYNTLTAKSFDDLALMKVLPKIDKVINSNAVRSVFVYDTNLDDDNGEWTNKTNNTSWYNETLNTTVRGKTKSFPKVAVLVAETKTLTIYDATDPDLPMWMVFTQGAYSYLYEYLSSYISSVRMKNGLLYVGTDYSGMSITSFIRDKNITSFYGNSTFYYFISLPIQNRNNTDSSFVNTKNIDGTGEIKNSLVGSHILDIKITSKGNLENTLVIGTDNGATILFSDYSRANLTSSNTINEVSIFNDYIWLLEEPSVVHYGPLTNISQSVSSWRDGYYSSSSAPFIRNNPNSIANNQYIGATQGLTEIYQDMSCIRNASFITGWMPANTKVVALANHTVADRSKYDVSFALTGTLYNTPVNTGSELLSYSNFGASNYIEQPFNAALSIGTQDFIVSAWLKISSSYTWRCLLEVGKITTNDVFAGDGPLIMRYSNTTSLYIGYHIGNSRIYLEVPVLDNQWTHLTFVRKNGTLYGYSNGELQSTLSGHTEDITHTTEVTRIGRRISPSSWAWPSNSEVSLVKICTGSLSASQVKFIYEKEKMLFNENAKCLLPQSEVKALDYDSSTKVATVSTTSSLVKIQDLLVVDSKTQTATTISSVSGRTITGK